MHERETDKCEDDTLTVTSDDKNERKKNESKRDTWLTGDKLVNDTDTERHERDKYERQEDISEEHRYYECISQTLTKALQEQIRRK